MFVGPHELIAQGTLVPSPFTILSSPNRFLLSLEFDFFKGLLRDWD